MKKLDILIKCFKNLKGAGSLKQIFSEYILVTNVLLSKNDRNYIVKLIEHHSSDSKSFEGKDDLFYSVYGLGNGIWGLRDYSRFKAKKTNKKPLVNIIIEVIKNNGGIADTKTIIKKVEEITGIESTRTRKNTIRKVLSYYSSDSKSFKNKQDYFYSVFGVGKGVFGLRNYKHIC